MHSVQDNETLYNVRFIDSLPGRGRKLKTTARDNRVLVRLSLRARTKATSNLKAEWQEVLGFPVSHSLMNVRLLMAGLFARRPRRKPLLQERHRQRCLEWAQGHRHIHLLQRQHVIFSYDARVEIYRCD